MVRAVGIAIANYVDHAGLQRRRLDALTIEHYEAMGIAACAEYVNQRETERRNSSLPRQEWEM
jgi:type IV secretory pathway component VirB8